MPIAGKRTNKMRIFPTLPCLFFAEVVISMEFWATGVLSPYFDQVKEVIEGSETLSRSREGRSTNTRMLGYRFWQPQNFDAGAHLGWWLMVVCPCLTSLGLVESVHGHHSTKLIGHMPLIDHSEPTFNVAGTS